MVEVQHDNVALSAIYARMSRKMGIHETAVSFFINLGEYVASCVGGTLRAAVVFAYIFQLTRLAIRTRETIALLEKCIERLRLNASCCDRLTSLCHHYGTAIERVLEQRKKQPRAGGGDCLFVLGVADRDRTGDLRNHNPTL